MPGERKSTTLNEQSLDSYPTIAVKKLYLSEAKRWCYAYIGRFKIDN